MQSGSRRYYTVFILLLAVNVSHGQKSLNLSLNYPPGSGNFRSYAIYEPAGFNASKANKLIIGFHPYGPGTWDCNSWRDTLRTFIDLTRALLVCPDGGPGGLTDESEDYDFTDTLIEVISSNYLIDSSRVFAMGFSAGGKAAYEYGLSRDMEIAGVIPIGAAIDGVDFSGIISASRCRPFYIIHGEKDKPNSRYFPIKADLIAEGALVDGILLANVGHTIDFPQRNSILKMAFNFVDTAGCDYTQTEEGTASHPAGDIQIISKGHELRITTSHGDERILSVYNDAGQRMDGPRQFNSNNREATIETSSWPAGLYIVTGISGKIVYSVKILIY